jgi:hypothetical protein
VILHKRRLAVVLATLTTAAAVVGVAGPAQADLPYPLPSGSTYVFPTPNPSQVNTFVTTADYWSVVGIQSPVGAQYLLAVNDSSGTSIGASSLPPVSGQQTVSFVAVNNNAGYSPIGTYQGVTADLGGSGDYEMQYANPTQTLSTTEPFAPQTMSMGPGQFITIADVYLVGGQGYRFDASFFQQNDPPGNYGEMYLMPSTSKAAGAEQALWSCGTVWGCTHSWTATQSGWYAVVVVAVGRSSVDEPWVSVDACALLQAGQYC